eukprot:CAMPEP_0194228182 /NCGR_PEP_ID=MMETSP0156-20130528/43243_1 /TAXON_ID=33649 /ORGANISM="Thalassionema nitzschioides, Strain L26-B" /LENGTH=431 /DNA_ID=CAMNT_0038960689 /DNA_START=13 /DNA_END=1308 /DNA_ORIENTATION=+
MKFLILLICLSLSSSTKAFQGIKAPHSCSTFSSTESGTTLKYKDEVEYLGGLQTEFQTQVQLHTKIQRSDPLKSGIKMDKVRMLMLSQFFLLSGATVVTIGASAFSGNGGNLGLNQWTEIGIFKPYFSGEIWRLVEAILGAVPIVLTGNVLAKSGNREYALVDFSTTNMVMALFGRRIHDHENDIFDHPPVKPETPMIHTLLFSGAISVLTGVCEEIVFRGLTPAVIFYYSHSPALALFGQAFLFGLRHVSPKASQAENRSAIALQTASGLWYGIIFMLAGGDLLPCIVAHALCDLHMFMKTWMHTNYQMDYTENAVLQPLTQSDKLELRQVKQEAGSDLSVETFAFLRRFFYAFDYDRVGTLSRADVQRAACYAFINEAEMPNPDRIDELFTKILSARVQESYDDSNTRLKLPEFLRVIISLRANSSDKI